MQRQQISRLTGRATPSQWMRNSNCKQAINLFLTQEKSSRLGLKLEAQALHQ